jgi:hypothetical protein
MTNHTHLLICTTCYAERIPPARRKLGYMTCLSCGEKAASKVRHTIAPMHKSNYMLFTDLNDLKGINNKGGLHR